MRLVIRIFMSAELVVASGFHTASAEESIVTSSPPHPSITLEAEALVRATPSSERDAVGAAGLSLRVRAGVTTAPFATVAFPETSGHGMIVMMSGYGRALPGTWIGARVPIALMSVRQPAGSYVDEAAWGNPELYLEREWLRQDGSAVSIAARTRLAVGLPWAEHGSRAGLMENRALAMADALEGFRDRELFLPGFVPLGMAGQLTLSTTRWVFGAHAKLPLFFRVSDADLSPSTETRALGVTPVFGLRAQAWVSSRLGLSLDGHAVFNARAPRVDRGEGSGVQPSLQPSLLWRVAAGRLAGADLLVPVGGPLGGSTVAAGVYFIGQL
jgi:hypothetical protein